MIAIPFPPGRTVDRGAIGAPVLVVLALLVFLACGRAQAQEAEVATISAHEAWDLAQQDRIVIVDVRTQGEWRETGTAPGAVRISLYNNWGVPNFSFADEVLAALGGDPDRPVALICATGGRSSYAAGELHDAGLTHVADISEGMLGSKDGLGWMSRALPIADCGDCEPDAPN